MYIHYSAVNLTSYVQKNVMNIAVSNSVVQSNRAYSSYFPAIVYDAFSIFLSWLILFFIFINKNKKFEIITSPVYYILLLISTIWFSYVLLITLDPNF